MKNKIIVGVSGHIGSGKTTFCNLLMKELETYGKVVINHRFLNFADKLKQICYLLTGYYGYTQEEKQIYLPEYDFTVGTALQLIGTNAMRDNFHKDVWVKSTMAEIQRDEINNVFIIGDCRFPNEAELIKQSGGILIRINGDPADVRKNSTRDLNHASETSLDNFDGFHYIYENVESIEQLKKFATDMAIIIFARLYPANITETI